METLMRNAQALQEHLNQQNTKLLKDKLEANMKGLKNFFS